MVSSNSNTGLETSVLTDDSFAKFIRNLDRSLLFDNDFISALYKMNPDALTDERFTSFLLSQGPDIFLDDSFVQFASTIDRNLLSDGSFSAFLNGIGRSALTDDAFTETLLALDSQVITSGNFTRALLAVDEDMLKSADLQQALKDLEPELLTNDNFAGLLSSEALSEGATISADAIRAELNSLNGGLMEDDLLSGGRSATVPSSDIGTNNIFSDAGTVASVDPAVVDFINAGDHQPLVSSDELGLQSTAGLGAGEAVYPDGDFLLGADGISDSVVQTQERVGSAMR